MRLNPPASSSDLDVARAAARRLHDRARRPEGSDEGSAPAPPRSKPPAPAPPPPPEPPAFQPPDFEPPLPEPEAPALSEPAPEPEVATLEPEPAPEPEPEPEPTPEPFAEPAPVPAEPETAPPFEALEPEPSPPAFEPEPEPPTSESEPPDLESTDLGTPLDEELPVEPQLEDLAPAAEDSSADDAWGTAPDDALNELAAPAEPSLEGLDAPYPPPGQPVSPEDLLGGDPLSEAEPPLDLGAPALGEDEAERAPDDLVTSPGPSWDDVADACLALAQAHGAMLVDPSGQVLTARGDWPEPGPDAIAGRLVSMMERTLQDAPTRSVSAPIGGQHLTAWRIPASDAYLTVVFMGEASLSADERPAIDDHIGQALES